MTLPASERISQVYITNGSTKRFDFNFPLFTQSGDSGGVTVRRKIATGFEDVPSNLYTTLSSGSGGFVFFESALPSGQYIYIVGNTPISQTLSITNYGNFNANAIERVLDKLIAILQERVVQIDQEAQARILADIYYQNLAIERESELKQYIDGVVAGITGQPFFSIPDSFVMLQNGRTQRMKNAETVSLKDFGALGDGITDDTASINAALATTKALYVPDGIYLFSGDIDALLDRVYGNGLIKYQDFLYPASPVKTINHLWQGAFNAWQMGHALNVNPVQRAQVPAGVTHARRGFVTDTTVYHVNGTHDQHAMKVARKATTSDTATHNIVINLTPSEASPLLGKQCTLMYHCNKGANWQGGNITIKVQASKELMQPILRDDGQYTSGNIVLVSAAHAPVLRAKSAPYLLTFEVPEDATQISISVDIPFIGTAGADDWVELESMCLGVSGFAFSCIDEPAISVQMKAATRYQSSYQSGITRGSPIEQGAIQAIAAIASPTYAFAMPIRFDPPMAQTPWVTFQSPTSGTAFRLLNKTTGANVNGMAYDLNNKGVLITNNGAVALGDRLLCHYTAECLI